MLTNEQMKYLLLLLLSPAHVRVNKYEYIRTAEAYIRKSKQACIHTYTPVNILLQLFYFFAD